MYYINFTVNKYCWSISGRVVHLIVESYRIILSKFDSAREGTGCSLCSYSGYLLTIFGGDMLR